LPSENDVTNGYHYLIMTNESSYLHNMISIVKRSLV